MAFQTNNGANYARFGTNARICSGRSFTIEAWINASSYPANAGDGGGFNVFVGGQSSAPVGWELGYQSYNSTLYLGWTPDGANYYGYGVPGLGDSVSVAAPTGRWFHVAAVFMAETLRYALYVDGRAAALSPAFAAGPGSATAALGLRQSYDNAGFTYTGALARVRLYEGALGGRAIERSMRSPVVPADLRSRVLADVPLRREPTLVVRDEGPSSLGVATQTGTVTQAADPDTAPPLRRLRAVRAPGGTAYVRAITSSIDVTSSAGRALAAARLTSATVAHSATVARAEAAGRTLAASVAHTASVAAQADRARTILATATHSASVARATAATRPIAASVAHTTTATTQSARQRTLAASTAHSAAVGRSQGLARDVAASVAHSVALARLAAVGRALASTVASSATVTRAGAFVRTLASSVASSALVEGVRSGPGALTRTIAASVAHTASVARQTDAGRALASSVTHAAEVTRASVLGRALSWAGSILATLARAFGVVIPPSEGSMLLPALDGAADLPDLTGSAGLPGLAGAADLPGTGGAMRVAASDGTLEEV